MPFAPVRDALDDEELLPGPDVADAPASRRVASSLVENESRCSSCAFASRSASTSVRDSASSFFVSKYDDSGW